MPLEIEAKQLILRNIPIGNLLSSFKVAQSNDAVTSFVQTKEDGSDRMSIPKDLRGHMSLDKNLLTLIVDFVHMWMFVPSIKLSMKITIIAPNNYVESSDGYNAILEGYSITPSNL